MLLSYATAVTRTIYIMPILELEPHFRSDLRAAAHSLRPVVQIGDKGLSDAVMLEIERALNAHGLIKIRVAGEDRSAREAMQARICTNLDCAPVHHLGKVLVVYRPTDADPAGQAFRRNTGSSVAGLGVQPRKPDEPHVPKKLAAIGKSAPLPERKRPVRPAKPAAPSNARERYLGTGGRPPRPSTGRDTTPTRSSRPAIGSALSLRAGARRATSGVSRARKSAIKK